MITKPRFFNRGKSLYYIMNYIHYEFYSESHGWQRVQNYMTAILNSPDNVPRIPIEATTKEEAEIIWKLLEN